MARPGKIQTVEGSTIMYSGKETGRRSAGVAFIVNSETLRAVLGYNPVSERVITLRVNAKPVIIRFVQVYAPTGASSDEEITSFYEQLQGVLDTVCRKDVIVIMGDWNAKIGKSVHKSDNIGAVTSNKNLHHYDQRWNGHLEISEMGRHQEWMIYP